MKIATWNLMRPTEKTRVRNEVFLQTLKACNADILVLTETNSIIHPGTGYYSLTTKPLPEIHEGFTYSKGENRVSLFSRFPFGRQFPVADEYTSVCAKILTPLGPLVFYATIMGVTGGKDQRFKTDFESQKTDPETGSSMQGKVGAGRTWTFKIGHEYTTLYAKPHTRARIWDLKVAR